MSRGGGEGRQNTFAICGAEGGGVIHKRMCTLFRSPRAWGMCVVCACGVDACVMRGRGARAHVPGACAWLCACVRRRPKIGPENGAGCKITAPHNPIPTTPTCGSGPGRAGKPVHSAAAVPPVWPPPLLLPFSSICPLVNRTLMIHKTLPKFEGKRS